MDPNAQQRRLEEISRLAQQHSELENKLSELTGGLDYKDVLANKNRKNFGDNKCGFTQKISLFDINEKYERKTNFNSYDAEIINIIERYIPGTFLQAREKQTGASTYYAVMFKNNEGKDAFNNVAENFPKDDIVQNINISNVKEQYEVKNVRLFPERVFIRKKWEQVNHEMYQTYRSNTRRLIKEDKTYFIVLVELDNLIKREIVDKTKSERKSRKIEAEITELEQQLAEKRNELYNNA